jgi:hypothetical protein
VESALRIITSGKLSKYEAGVGFAAAQAVRKINNKNGNRFIQNLLLKKDDCIKQKFPLPLGNGNFFNRSTNYDGVVVAVGVAVGVIVGAALVVAVDVGVGVGV